MICANLPFLFACSSSGYIRVPLYSQIAAAMRILDRLVGWLGDVKWKMYS